MKLVDVQEMKQLDQLATAEYAVPGILLKRLSKENWGAEVTE